MKPTSKLSSAERRAAIIKAVRQVFAEKGFHGTTTRALAEAAGVSEALLFKHFPDKEALYSAMMLSCCQEKEPGTVERLLALKPSASALVVLVHLLVSHQVGRPLAADGDEAIQRRLMLRSLAEDGDFARLFLKGMPSRWVGKMEECLQAAVAAGDASPGPIPAGLGGWFAHNLAAMIMMLLLPAEPAVDFGVPREQLVEQVVWFALRGLGLKEEVIQRHYNPKALALLLG